MWLVLFANLLFSECDVVVDKVHLASIKEEYLSTTYRYNLNGVFYIDDKDYKSCDVTYNCIYDNWKNEFIRTATIFFQDKTQYTCSTEDGISTAKEFEDFIIDCACQHGWFYYMLKSMFKNTGDWSYGNSNYNYK